MKTFPIGSIVLIDGKQRARVAQVFHEGSVFFPWPHYCVVYEGGQRSDQVKVPFKSVGVRKINHSPRA